MAERFPTQIEVEARERGQVEASLRLLEGRPLDSLATILHLAVPLILSMGGLMVMILLNRLFLSWYSQEAVAAIGPAGMTGYLLMSLFIGAASFSSTMVAQYIGAGQPRRAGAAIWQGVYFSLLSGGLVALCSFLAKPIFTWGNHPPEVCALEIVYFRISCWGAPLVILAAALSGFFSGRGDTRTLMVVQLIGFALNVFLDYVLIFGKLGFPELGMAGAAWATVIAEGVLAVVLLALFLMPRYRDQFGTWRLRFEAPLLARLIRFGLPNGARFAIELLAWCFFLFFAGRLGKEEGWATNIAFTINGFAFFPVVGLSEAIRVLVGHAQGQQRPHLAMRCAWKGLALAELWMLGLAALYFYLPGPLVGMFHDQRAMSADEFARLSAMCVALLRFVALYCLLDGVNITIMGALLGAGDTAWTMVVSVMLHLVFLTALFVLDQIKPDLMIEWAALTAFVMVQAFFWLGRFLSGRWRHVQVIERAPESA
jgi:MATE family multidrug resistance protein